MELKIKFICILVLGGLCGVNVNAQVDSILQKLKLESDFRFRVEHDWDSRRSDGTFRDDRTRLRYRLRTGASFSQDWYSIGFRIRTGDQNKQQDPQLTLGKGFKEFGTLPIGLEKIFFQGKHGDFRYWVGKNTLSFDKNNELFWSDNVYPEGVYVEQVFNPSGDAIERITVQAAHYIISSNDGSILDDAYVQGVQSTITFKDDKLKIFPALYLMRNIPDIPDGSHTALLDYSILHLGGRLAMIKDLTLDFDFYHNLEDYTTSVAVDEALQSENNGLCVGLQYGQLKAKNDWLFKVTYTELQRFAALDYMAQNDWARWDYSSFNSPDGRLTNMRGIELVVGYNINEKINLIAKYYNVSQIVTTGPTAENGQRFRIDINVKFFKEDRQRRDVTPIKR